MKKRTLAVILGLVLVVSTALAAGWIITSSGSGSAKVGSLTPPTITASTSPVADLYPSNTIDTGSLQLHIVNPNPTTLYLTSFTASKANIGGGNASCDWGYSATSGGGTVYVGERQNLRWNGHVYGPGGDTVTFPGVFIDPFSIPVPNGASDISIPGTLGLSESTLSACQGEAITGFQVTNALFQTAP